MTATGSDGLPIGAGDLIQTRKNDAALGVANRQQWVVGESNSISVSIPAGFSSS